MELKDWGLLLELLGSPLAIIYLAFVVYRLQDQVKDSNLRYEALREEIHDNGFVRKDVLDALAQKADSEHTSFQHQIDAIFARINK